MKGVNKCVANLTS